MKSSKKPSKEPPLPSQDEARRTNVLMEQMLSKFNVFGEVQSDLRDRVGRIETDLHSVKEDVAVLKSVVRSQGETLRSQGETLRSQGETLRSHSEELRSIRSDVSEIKADLKIFNHRLEIVEAKVAS